MIETHCHLDYLKSLPREEILAKCKDVNVVKMITISVAPDNLHKALEIANEHDNVFCSQGIHPHEAKLWEEDVEETIRTNAKSESKVVAIGEIGLDYHYDNSPREKQREVFSTQLQIAIDLNLPVIIHSRDADEDTISILKEFAPKMTKKGVIHSFTSGPELAQFAIDAGFHLGFNGIITFKTAENVREITRMTPIEQILLETDSPFLTPVPHRGKENAPYYLPHIADKVAELKGLSTEEVIKITTANAESLFAI